MSGTGYSADRAGVRGLALVRRIAREHCRLVVPLGLALIVNAAAYALVVLPLSRRVATIEERNWAAEQALAAAQREHQQATGLLRGKDRAARELETFYTKVLPRDLAGARRLTLSRLAQLARAANLERERVQIQPVQGRDSTLTRLRIQMTLTGSYPSVRAFIHALESAPEFVVIDHVELTEGAEGGVLQFDVELSTYFRPTPEAL